MKDPFSILVEYVAAIKGTVWVFASTRTMLLVVSYRD